MIKVIKRYKNRKFYDVEICEYITLKNIIIDILNGRELLIFDNETKRDITSKTLLKGFATYAHIDITSCRELINLHITYGDLK